MEVSLVMYWDVGDLRSRSRQLSSDTPHEYESVLSFER